jgi:hypothetical protein
LSEHAVPGMTCCNQQLRELSSATRPGHKEGRVQRVVVYQCEVCDRVDARGESCDGGWVFAKAELFLQLRREAFERAGQDSLHQ